MKKLLLVLLMVFSLNAGELLCKDSEKRWQKHFQLSSFAIERGKMRLAMVENTLTLKYLERSFANCDYSQKKKEVGLRFRKELIELDKMFKEL